MVQAPKIRFKNFHEDWIKSEIWTFYDFKNWLNKWKSAFWSWTPIVNFTDVLNNRWIESCKLKWKVTLNKNEIKNYNVRKWDLFFTRTSETIEEIWYPSVMLDDPKDTVFSWFVLRWRKYANIEDPLDDYFKKYVFFTNLFRREMIKKSSKTTRALTSWTAIKKMEFYYPKNKEEQKHIWYFLSELDNIIEEFSEKTIKLYWLKQSFIQRLFPLVWDVSPRIRINKYKENRKVKKLWDLCTPISIKNRNRTDLEVFSVSNKEWFIRQTEHFKDNEVASKDKSNYKIVSRNQFAYNTSRINVWSIARLKDEDAVIVSPLYIIFECWEELDETYLEYFLKTEAFDKQRRINTEISVRETLSYDGFSRIDINIPGINEQREIWLFLKNLDEQIKNQKLKIEKIRNLRKALLQKMFI